MQRRMSFPEYIEALERERSKVEVFQRELPLCLELITQAIEACKQQLSGTTTVYNLHGQSECSEQTSTEGPVLEEFIPLKKRAASEFRDGEDADDEDENDDEEHSHKSKVSREMNHIDKKKSDWLSSVQLWNPDPPVEEDVTRKERVTDVKENGGAFKPFQREKIVGNTNASTTKASTSSVPMPSTSSTSERDRGDHAGSSKKEDKEGQRKQRRCWSPELHKRFLNSIEQIGGSDVATPKQIRELMKVDGLTNDEVKSHLQKYRLHSRRPCPTIPNNANPQTPQFVLVGGIWVQPSEYGATATTSASGEVTSVSAAPNGIYSPVATHPPTVPHPQAPLSHKPKPKQTDQSESEQLSQSEDRASHSEGGVHSNSPASSSSTH